MRALSYLKKYRLLMAVAWTLMGIELAVELLHPLFMAKIIDEGIVVKDLSQVMKWGGVMVGMSFFAFAAGITNSFFSAKVSQGFGFDVRGALFKKVQSFAFSNLSKFESSSLVTRLTNDVTQVQNTVFMSLRIMLRAPLLAAGGIIMAFWVNAKLALILFIPMPFLLVLLVYMMNRNGRQFKQVQRKLDDVNEVIQENLTGIRLVRAFLRRKYEEGKFRKANETLRDGTVRAFRTVELTAPILLFVMNAALLVVLWFGSKQITGGSVKLGELVAVVNYGFRITSALSMLTFIIMAFSRGKASLQRIDEVLDEPVDMMDNPSSTEANISGGSVEFDDVTFTYPGKQDPAVSDLTFTVGAGKTAAVMGATGAGKSTLFGLIPRLYDPQKGQVKIDGVDVKRVQAETLRRQIGYSPQEAFLFTGTIRENIAWGSDRYTMEEVVQAAKDAQIHETIMKFPEKYETKVGQKGVNLSGGQKQRLAIARALIRKPSLLMLDDSTSALDLATEQKLLEAVKRYECTLLLVTQKISAAMSADVILLLDDGRLLAKGTHAELLRNSELYMQIYKTQFPKGVRQHG